LFFSPEKNAAIFLPFAFSTFWIIPLPKLTIIWSSRRWHSAPIFRGSNVQKTPQLAEKPSWGTWRPDTRYNLSTWLLRLLLPRAIFQIWSGTDKYGEDNPGTL
jgi:hypothetical protein